MALFCDNLEFPRRNLPKFSQHIKSLEIRILNTKKVGFVKAGFSIFANLCPTTEKKLVLFNLSILSKIPLGGWKGYVIYV